MRRLCNGCACHLVANALEATEGGQGRLLSVSASEEDGRICIVFDDSGSDIDSDVVAKMFDRGFTTKGVAHLGMGLAMARKELERFNGSIDYDESGRFQVYVIPSQ